MVKSKETLHRIDDNDDDREGGRKGKVSVELGSHPFPLIFSFACNTNSYEMAALKAFLLQVMMFP